MSPGPRRRVVLSDAEQTQLRQIQQQLDQQDPDYVRELRRATALLLTRPVPPADLRPLREGAWWVAIAFAFLFLAGGSVAGALAMCLLGLAARSCCAPGTAVGGGPEVSGPSAGADSSGSRNRQRGRPARPGPGARLAPGACRARPLGTQVA